MKLISLFKFALVVAVLANSGVSFAQSRRTQDPETFVSELNQTAKTDAMAQNRSFTLVDGRYLLSRSKSSEISIDLTGLKSAISAKAADLQYLKIQCHSVCIKHQFNGMAPDYLAMGTLSEFASKELADNSAQIVLRMAEAVRAQVGTRQQSLFEQNRAVVVNRNRQECLRLPIGHVGRLAACEGKSARVRVLGYGPERGDGSRSVNLVFLDQCTRAAPPGSTFEVYSCAGVDSGTTDDQRSTSNIVIREPSGANPSRGGVEDFRRLEITDGYGVTCMDKYRNTLVKSESSAICSRSVTDSFKCFSTPEQAAEFMCR